MNPTRERAPRMIPTLHIFSCEPARAFDLDFERHFDENATLFGNKLRLCEPKASGSSTK